VPKLYFETDSDERCPIKFADDAQVLVYFLSLAFATRYGAQHEFSKLALLLRGEHKIDLKPLLTFADRDVEVEADAKELERAWQEAEPLAECLRRVAAVLSAPDESVAAMLAEWPELVSRLDELRRMAEWAAERGARVRLSYEL
jgi:hypothetical protein